MFRCNNGEVLNLVLSHAFIDGWCATGFASVPHWQEALAKPVAHINTRLTEHQARDSSLIKKT